MASYTHDEVSAALNKAADDVLATLEKHGYVVGDEGARDLLNLMVNVTADYLDGAATTVEEVVENDYAEPADDVLSWAATAL